MRRRRSSAPRTSISAWLLASPAGRLVVLDRQGLAASGPLASGSPACLMAKLVAWPQHRVVELRVVARLLCHHPVSVSQVLLRVDTGRGLLFLARGAVLADLLMDLRQP